MEISGFKSLLVKLLTNVCRDESVRMIWLNSDEWDELCTTLEKEFINTNMIRDDIHELFFHPDIIEKTFTIHGKPIRKRVLNPTIPAASTAPQTA